jgi:hypothetical protein
MLRDGNTGRLVAEPLEERFWNNVYKEHPSGCWLWEGSTDRGGYGWVMGMGERKAHRVSWVIHFGVIPDELFVLHKCDNPSCVNPEHLYLGTHLDNVRDAKERKRYRGAVGDANGLRKYPEKVRGSNNGMSKLTEADVVEMRQLRAEGARVSDIAEKYKLTCAHTSKILVGKLWSHVPGSVQDHVTNAQRGSDRYCARLTEEQVVEIRKRRASGETGDALAAEYGVHKATLSDITRGKTWKHVGGPITRGWVY